MSQSRLAANRANAQLSTGPRTEEGKKRSSLNAFRHGLTGHIVIHTPDQQAFQKHCDAIRESLAAVGALETTLAQSIAQDYWASTEPGPSKTPSSPSAFKTTPTSPPATPRSTPPSPKAAPGSNRPATSSSLPPTNSASAAPSKRTQPSFERSKPRAKRRRASGRESPPPRPARRIPRPARPQL